MWNSFFLVFLKPPWKHFRSLLIQCFEVRITPPMDVKLGTLLLIPNAALVQDWSRYILLNILNWELNAMFTEIIVVVWSNWEGARNWLHNLHLRWRRSGWLFELVANSYVEIKLHTYGFQPRSAGLMKRIPARDTVAGVAVLRWEISNRSRMLGVSAIRSLLASVRILLSSMTVLSDSIHMGSMSPSSTIQRGLSPVIWARSRMITENKPEGKTHWMFITGVSFKVFFVVQCNAYLPLNLFFTVTLSEGQPPFSLKFLYSQKLLKGQVTSVESLHCTLTMQVLDKLYLQATLKCFLCSGFVSKII